MENQYLEREKYGNGYRKTYQEGLVSLLKSLKEQAQGKRDSYMSEMQAHPDALRKKVRQTIGWPLTESDRVLPNAQMNFVARDALADSFSRILKADSVNLRHLEIPSLTKCHNS